MLPDSMSKIRRIQIHRISLEKEMVKLEDTRDLTSNIRKHSYRHWIHFGKSKGAGPGLRVWEDFRSLKQASTWGS